jgi:hypothetical protein
VTPVSHIRSGPSALSWRAARSSCTRGSLARQAVLPGGADQGRCREHKQGPPVLPSPDVAGG